MEVREIQAQDILMEYPKIDGGWTWSKYMADPYVGCQYGCSFCADWDEDCMNLSDADKESQIAYVKVNAAELLEAELQDKEREIIHLGDWQELEKKYRISRRMLQICQKMGFPVFTLVKSKNILDDIGLLKKMSKETYVNVGISMITVPEFSGYQQIRFFEHGAPTIEERLHTMQKLSQAGIYTGTFFMPILPYIFDQEENIEAVCKATRNAGGSYVIAHILTLEGEQKELFHNVLRKNFSDVQNKYVNLYRNGYAPKASYVKDIMEMVEYYADKYHLETEIKRFIPETQFYANKKIAEMLHNRARKIELMTTSKTTASSYRNAGHFLDSLNYDLNDVYSSMHVEGLKKIPGIGGTLAVEIAHALEEINKQKTS